MNDLHPSECPLTIRVIKLGGSLFDLQDFPERLTTWLASQALSVNLLIAGGGKMIDAVRDLDSIHGLPAEQVHWWCVECLDTTARLVKALLPEFELLASKHALNKACTTAAQMNAVVLPSAFYTPAESTKVLPTSWATTTDSIAALLATQVQASELVLCKSCSPVVAIAHPAKNAAERGILENWRQTAIVDGTFHTVAQYLPTVRCVDLRSLNG